MGFSGSLIQVLSWGLTLDLEDQGEPVIQRQEADEDPGVPQDTLVQVLHALRGLVGGLRLQHLSVPQDL